MGLEPTTSSLGSWHSTTELLPLAHTGHPKITRLLLSRVNVADREINYSNPASDFVPEMM